MAISPLALFPGQVASGDPGYPLGKAQNQTVVDDGTGTPLEERIVNDLFGFQQALLAEAGAAPSGVPDKVGASQYLDALKRLILTAQTDGYALNWRSFAGDDALTIPSERLQLAVGIDSAGRFESSLFVKTTTTGLLAKSRDFFQTWQGCTQLVDGSPVAITAMWGEVDRRNQAANNGLLVINNVSKIWQTLDAGVTWSAGVALGYVCSAIARLHPIGIVITAGTGVIKTLSAGLGSLTSRTVPGAWAALTAAGIAVARGGESSTAGAVIYPANVSNHLLHSPDGVTWTDSTVAVGQVVSACWSEAHGKWFALTSAGLLYSSPNPSTTAWELTTTLFNSIGGDTFYSVRAFGRSIVIACSLGCGPPNTETGTLIVSQNPNLTDSYLTLSTGVGRLGDVGAPDIGETTLIHHDGQLVAGHVHTYATGPTYAPNLSVSMRAPWV